MKSLLAVALMALFVLPAAAQVVPKTPPPPAPPPQVQPKPVAPAVDPFMALLQQNNDNAQVIGSLRLMGQGMQQRVMELEKRNAEIEKICGEPCTKSKPEPEPDPVAAPKSDQPDQK